jgi:periplasmic mercuric ion binding protein
MFKAGLISFLLLSGSALAAEPRTVTLGVEHMTCAACPITVRKALSHVAGVSAATVDMKAHTATITFDPTRTTPEALATAVSNAGFPARVLRNGS